MKYLPSARTILKVADLGLYAGLAVAVTLDAGWPVVLVIVTALAVGLATLYRLQRQDRLAGLREAKAALEAAEAVLAEVEREAEARRAQWAEQDAEWAERFERLTGRGAA